MISFGERFHQARKAALLTQKEAAAVLGLDCAQTISNWECHRSSPWPGQQEAVLAALAGHGSRPRVVDAILGNRPGKEY